LRSSRGHLWDQAKWAECCLRGLRRLTKIRPCKLRWPGCWSGRRSCCLFRGPPRLNISRKMCRPLPCDWPTTNTGN